MGNKVGRRPTSFATLYGQFAIVVMLGIGLALAVWGFDASARWVDRRLADERGANVAASVRTRDAAPGSRVVVQVLPLERSTTVDVALPAIEQDHAGAPRTWKLSGGAGSFTTTLPTALAEGEARLVLLVRGRALGPGTYGPVMQEYAEELVLPLHVRSSGDALWWKLIHGGLALLGLLCGIGATYAIARSRFGFAEMFAGSGPPTARRRLRPLGSVGVVIIAAIFAIGHLVFARPIQMTTAISSTAFTTLLAVGWMFGLGLGGWRGTRHRREQLRWSTARLRAIEGSRSTLPAAMSRPVAPASAIAVTAAIRQANLGCDEVGRRLVLTIGGNPVARITPRKPGPWVPEDLGLEVRDAHDASAVARALVPLFGPLEYLPAYGTPIAIDPPSEQVQDDR